MMPDRETISHSDAGYTITELLVVLVILGVIAAAISPAVMGRLSSSKVRAAKLQMETVSASLDAYFIDTGRYPSKEEGLDVLLDQPTGEINWLGPYVRSSRNLIDPWGEKLIYDLQSHDQPTLTSLGADKSIGGEGAAADLQVPAGG